MAPSAISPSIAPLTTQLLPEKIASLKEIAKATVSIIEIPEKKVLPITPPAVESPTKNAVVKHSPFLWSGSNKMNWALGEKFQRRMPHHDGIKQLWEMKWKFPCSKSVYPFHDGKFEDFEPVFKYLIKNNINDGYGDAYTRAFFAPAELLTEAGHCALNSGNLPLASQLYLRAACLYRISRFPYISSHPVPKANSSVGLGSVKWQAWEAQKAVYMRAACNWEQPVKQHIIPHTAAAGKDRTDIPIYVRMPKHEDGERVPVVLLMTGLDGYRPDNTERSNEFIKRGWGCVIAEIPGTADCPADPADPESGDRLWTSILDFLKASELFDMQRVMVWGLSAGGYSAVRIAHTHKQRLRGSIAQGAGTHHFFGSEWLEKADGHEYPFSIWPAISLKHGFSSPEAYKANAQEKFSLVETKIVEKPATRLLLVNGTDDGLMPIEDSTLLLEYGTPKEARFFADALHMGYPLANSAVYPWMDSVMA